LLRDVAVAGDHDLKSRRLRFQIERGQIVQHVDEDAGEFNNFGLR
jgi:hypothetical protein